jgi:hypothetical protein
MIRLKITPLNYLLSSFVMAWGILPPALIHSHEGGGDTGHQHDEQTVAVALVDDHGHSHDGQSHELQAPVAADVSLLGSLVSHLHWDFLGIDLSIPLPAEDQRGDRVGEQDQVLVRLTEEMPRLSHGVNLLLALQATILEAKLDCVATRAAPSLPPGLTASIPLCDAARFERSGVLLS